MVSRYSLEVVLARTVDVSSRREAGILVEGLSKVRVGTLWVMVFLQAMYQYWI